MLKQQFAVNMLPCTYRNLSSGKLSTK